MKRHKLAFFIIIGVLGLFSTVVIVTGGEIFARWTTFLSDCAKVRVGDSVSQYNARMQKYIYDPDYDYMANTYGVTTTMSLADDSGFHMKTWRCLIESTDGVIRSVGVTTH